MEEKLIKDRLFLRKVADSYVLHRIKDNILTIEGDSQYTIGGIDPFYKLSTKNCQAVENGYDLDELVLDYEKENEEHIQVDERQRQSFKAGFQKALEILGDKKFNDEDMKEAIYIARDDDNLASTHIIESLQQTECDVEIVGVENTPIWEDADVQGHVVCKKCGEWNESQIIPYNCKCVSKPKLDADGCIILKRI